MSTYSQPSMWATLLSNLPKICREASEPLVALEKSMRSLLTRAERETVTLYRPVQRSTANRLAVVSISSTEETSYPPLSETVFQNLSRDAQLIFDLRTDPSGAEHVVLSLAEPQVALAMPN